MGKRCRTGRRRGSTEITVVQLKKVHADGSRLHVRHPEMMAYSEGARTTVVYGENGDFEIVDHLLVVGLEVRNGHAKRSKRK